MFLDEKEHGEGALAGGWTVNATLEGVIERKAFGKAKPLAVITGGGNDAKLEKLKETYCFSRAAVCTL